MRNLITLFFVLCSIYGLFGQDENVNWSLAPVVVADHPNFARGEINGIGYTYKSSQPIEFSKGIYSYPSFPSSMAIPNQTCIKNTKVTKNTIVFEQQVKDPYFLFSSIGRPNVMVPVKIDRPFTIEFQQGIENIGDNMVLGREGYLIIRIPGIHSEISFEYLAAENYANFMFGASNCRYNNEE